LAAEPRSRAVRSALFRQNDIDAEVLCDLTDADLEKLGLTLGHRKRLLKAIASLDGTEPVAKPTSPAPPSLSTDAAERRPITIMFCDLVGSTNLATLVATPSAPRLYPVSNYPRLRRAGGLGHRGRRGANF
jgi:class 3 adenylate cyclase